MRTGILAILPFLAACAETDVLTYQGRAASTASECEVAYADARRRAKGTPVYPSTGASLIGAAIGRGMVSGMTESHFKACLARVAADANGTVVVKGDVPTGASSVPVTPAQSPRSISAPQSTLAAGCAAGSGVMQGGTGYCLGN